MLNKEQLFLLPYLFLPWCYIDLFLFLCLTFCLFIDVNLFQSVNSGQDTNTETTRESVGWSFYMIDVRTGLPVSDCKDHHQRMALVAVF